MAVRPSVAEASPFETVVADVLRGTASEAKASYNEFASPWGLSFPAGICAGFHLVLEGQCWVRMADLAPVCASAGDVVLLPHGDGHTLSDRPDRPPTPFDPARHTNARQRGGEQATLLCGVYRFGGSGQPNPIRPLLPALIHLTSAEVRSNPSFSAVLGALQHEVLRFPAGNAVVERLVETLFVFIVRAWLEGRSRSEVEPTAALLDPQISRPLSQIHADPSRRWTVASLADTAGLSRAAFARRFADALGQPPLAYVTARRMDVAAQLLRDQHRSLAEIGAAVGYDSEFAFSRAFKRERGVSPGRFRSAPSPESIFPVRSAEGSLLVGEPARKGA